MSVWQQVLTSHKYKIDSIVRCEGFEGNFLQAEGEELSVESPVVAYTILHSTDLTTAKKKGKQGNRLVQGR